jgi:hypothetical protein
MSLSSPVRNTTLPLRVQACLNGAFAGGTGFSGPSHHIFVGSKAPWYEIGDALPQFEERKPVAG